MTTAPMTSRGGRPARLTLLVTGAVALTVAALALFARFGVTPRAGDRLALAGGTHDIAACPLLAATGVPCPLCGGIRSVVFALRGDGRWLDYNSLWPIVLAVLAAGGIWLTTRSATSFRDRLRRNPRASSIAAGALGLALLVTGELVALGNLGAIQPG